MIEIKIRNHTFAIQNANDSLVSELSVGLEELIFLVQSKAVGRRETRIRIADNISELCPGIDPGLIDYRYQLLANGELDENSTVMALDIDEIYVIWHHAELALIEKKIQKLKLLSVEHKQRREVKELVEALEQSATAMRAAGKTIQLDFLLDQHKEAKLTDEQNQILQQRIAEIKTDEWDAEE